MERTLLISACVREKSRTRKLAERVLQHIGGEVQICDLQREGLMPLNRESLQKRDTLIKSGDFSDPMFRFARDFAEADRIVVAAPYWDLGFPALLKTYLEHITVGGVTFCYGENGVPRGLCKARELLYVTTSGGPMFADFGFSYLKTLASVFYGIGEIVQFRAENLDIVDANVEGILENAFQEIDDYFVK